MQCSLTSQDLSSIAFTLSFSPPSSSMHVMHACFICQFCVCVGDPFLGIIINYCIVN